MPKVSIIMPVYNKQAYLREIFETLLVQTFTDWELIVVNDGSTDQSDAIIKEYVNQDTRISYIVQENRGVSVARNTGLKKAVGEWIWFVDADDLPNTDFLSHAFSKEYSRDVKCIVGSYECFENQCVTKIVEIEEKGNISPELLPKLFMKYQYEVGFWGYLWNKLLKRDFLQKNNITFKEGLTLAEDLKFMVSIYSSEIAIYYIPYVAMRYTVDATNSSREKKINYWEQLNIQLEIKEWIVDSKNQLEFLEHFKKIISSYAAFIIFYGFEDKEDIYSLIRKILAEEKVRELLCLENIESIMMPIVWCLIHKKYFLLKNYLVMRNKVRELYRVLFRKE